MGKKKPQKYADEKMHFLRVFALAIIAVGFILSGVLSVYTFAKTKDIVLHREVYRKQRDYECSEETDDREAITTGTRQLLTYDHKILDASRSRWSEELNQNPRFEKDNPNEPELPAGYRHATVDAASGSFLHNKLNNNLHVFANIQPGEVGQAGWYMDYFEVDSSKQYIFETRYALDQAQATIISEEVDEHDQRKYTDLSFLEPTSSDASKRLVFLPLPETKKMRFFIQLTTLGSLTIYEESVHRFDGMALDEPLVAISFDDGWESVFQKGKPLFDKLKIKTTQYIIAESFRSLLADYMNLDQVKQLEKDGHEIGSHSLRHCNLARLSTDDIQYDVAASKQILESEFHDIKGLAYPYGSYNHEVEDLASKNYDYIRTTETGYDGLLMNKRELRGITVTPALSMEEFRSIVDYAHRNKLWLNLIYHKIDEQPDLYGITPQALEEQLSYILGSGTKIVTAAEAVNSITKQQNEKFSQFLH